jgi:hypothetical protein
MTQIEIPIITGFKCKIFGLRTVPDQAVLIKLLRPGNNMKTAKLQKYKLQDAVRITDLGSQLLLQAYSNHYVDLIGNDDNFEKLHMELDFNLQTAKYCEAITQYITELLPNSVSNIKKLTNAAIQLNAINTQYASKKTILAIGMDLEQLIGFNSETIKFEMNPHLQNLYQRFPEYYIAKEYLRRLYLKAIEKNCSSFLEFTKQTQEKYDNHNKNRNNFYQIPIDYRPNRNKNIARQCCICFKWYEQKIANRNLQTHCGESSCKREWGRVRKPSKKTTFGWFKNYDKPQRCKGCPKIRLVDAEGFCKPCFTECVSQS